MTKFVVAAIGRCRDQPILDLIERYRTRLKWSLEIIELPPSKQHHCNQAIADESARLVTATSRAGTRVMLAEQGDMLTSERLAGWLNERLQQGQTPIHFVIGGAGGLDKACLSGADRVISLGRLTFPHMLVRALLVEQLYRAQTIIDGHPYHRS